MKDLIERLREWGGLDFVEAIDLMTEAADALERMQWQPIETAPKDDSPMLLACEFMPNDWRIKVGGWRTDLAKWNIFGGSWTPTYWMHLPPPKGEAK